MTHQFLSSSGDTFWVQRQNAPTSTAGTFVTINDTAPTSDRYNLSICEVLAPAIIGPDTTPPVVSITSPPNNSVLTGTVTLTASASDNVAVANVQFAVDGNLYGAPDHASAIQFNGTLRPLLKPCTLLRRSRPTPSNNQTTSAPAMLTVDETPPKVSITSPLAVRP